MSIISTPRFRRRQWPERRRSVGYWRSLASDCSARAQTLRGRGSASPIPVFTTAQRRVSSGFESKNWRVQRLGRTHGIEILAEERDLAACSPQEQHILLAIGTPRRLDEPLRLDFGDGAFGIGESIHPEVEEAEILHRSQEPRGVTDHRLPPREPRRMAEGGRIGEFPHQ